MTLALFDLDNALLSGDSDYSWGEFLADQGIVDRQIHSRKNAEHLADYKAGRLDIKAFLEFQLEPLKIYPRRLMETTRDQFMEKIIQPMITRQARELIKKHRELGHTLMIVTATNRFITGPIAAELGIDLLIATEVEEIDGRFTGHTLGIPSFSEGKVSRLRSWLASSGEDLRDSWFYSDSHNDLPLLKIVDHPVALNPEPILKKEALLQQWPIIEW